MTHHYLVGGISIASDIYYPELIESKLKPEVTICYGSIPEHLANNKLNSKNSEANDSQFLLKLPNIGKYLIENGNKITIELEKNAAAYDLEKYLLVTPFAILSHQRGILPMLGGVIIINGKGVLLTGASGNGKSTLLAALLKKGYPLISDDISNIKIIDGKVMALPSFPKIKLLNNTINMLDLDIQEGQKTRSDINKYYFQLNTTDFYNPIELTKVVVLKKERKTENSTIIKGADKIRLLAKNDFAPSIAKLFWNKNSYFNFLATVANSIELEEFTSDRSIGLELLRDSFIRSQTHT